MSDGEEKGGWWGNWVKSAKDKSLSALNMVKKDLAEFSSVMHDDTVKAASKVKEKLTQENANAATEKVKQGVSNFLGGISKALVIEPDDNYQPAQGGEAIVFDRYKARLHALQVDPATYTTEPTGDSYQQWLMETNLDSMKGDISDLLVSNVEVRALYTQLVPCSVSNIDFWKRYYFRQHLLEEEEARRLKLMKRAEDTKEQKDLGWDEDDDDWTEARTISSGPIEGCDTKLMTTAVVETKVNAEEGFTTVLFSSGVLEEKVAEPVEIPRILDTDPPTVSMEVNETMAEVLTKPNTESDLETISRADTSSSNFSEELLAPPSDNSVNSIAMLTVGDAQLLESGRSSEPSLSGWSSLSDAKSSEEDSTKMATLEKLEVAEHLQGRKTSDDSSNAKESLDDEWEKDFDVEVTEEDLAAAQKYLKNDEVKKTEGAEGGPEDWEDW